MYCPQAFFLERLIAPGHTCLAMDIVRSLFGTASPAPASSQQAGSNPSASNAPNSSQPPASYVLKRFIINSSFYWSWVPYIVLIATQEYPDNFRCALIFGTAFHGFAVIFHLVAYFTKWKPEIPYFLDIAFVIYFAVHCGIWERKPFDWQDSMRQYMKVSVHAWLCVMMCTSLAARYPFPLQYAKQVSPPEAWTAPSLRMVCDQLAGAWAIAEAVTTLLALAPLQTGNTFGKNPLHIIFDYIWPYLVLVGMTAFTRWWPVNRRELVYIPRMKNAVKPETPAAAAGGNGTSNGSVANGTSGTSPPGPTSTSNTGAGNSAGTGTGAGPAGTPKPGTPAGVQAPGALQGITTGPPGGQQAGSGPLRPGQGPAPGPRAAAGPQGVPQNVQLGSGNYGSPRLQPPAVQGPPQQQQQPSMQPVSSPVGGAQQLQGAPQLQGPPQPYPGPAQLSGSQGGYYPAVPVQQQGGGQQLQGYGPQGQGYGQHGGYPQQRQPQQQQYGSGGYGAAGVQSPPTSYAPHQQQQQQGKLPPSPPTAPAMSPYPPRYAA